MHEVHALHSFERTISKTNTGSLIATYLASVEEIGNSLGDHKVLQLLKVLKREALGAGPYPHVTMFEAANRILSDLVILYRREVATGQWEDLNRRSVQRRGVFLPGQEVHDAQEVGKEQRRLQDHHVQS